MNFNIGSLQNLLDTPVPLPSHGSDNEIQLITYEAAIQHELDQANDELTILEFGDKYQFSNEDVLRSLHHHDIRTQRGGSDWLSKWAVYPKKTAEDSLQRFINAHDANVPIGDLARSFRLSGIKLEAHSPSDSDVPFSYTGKRLSKAQMPELRTNQIDSEWKNYHSSDFDGLSLKALAKAFSHRELDPEINEIDFEFNNYGLSHFGGPSSLHQNTGGVAQKVSSVDTWTNYQPKDFEGESQGRGRPISKKAPRAPSEFRKAHPRYIAVNNNTEVIDLQQTFAKIKIEHPTWRHNQVVEEVISSSEERHRKELLDRKNELQREFQVWRQLNNSSNSSHRRAERLRKERQEMKRP